MQYNNTAIIYDDMTKISSDLVIIIFVKASLTFQRTYNKIS